MAFDDYVPDFLKNWSYGAPRKSDGRMERNPHAWGGTPDDAVNGGIMGGVDWSLPDWLSGTEPLPEMEGAAHERGEWLKWVVIAALGLLALSAFGVVRLK
nr:hypothetical protein 19 [Moraxellaceae bacterium]